LLESLLLDRWRYLLPCIHCVNVHSVQVYTCATFELCCAHIQQHVCHIHMAVCVHCDSTGSDGADTSSPVSFPCCYTTHHHYSIMYSTQACNPVAFTHQSTRTASRKTTCSSATRPELHCFYQDMMTTPLLINIYMATAYQDLHGHSDQVLRVSEQAPASLATTAYTGG
jgi:hypothetical protein